MADLARIMEAFSSHRHVWTYWENKLGFLTVLDALHKELPHIDVQSWEARFVLGGVYINGKPLFKNAAFVTPCRIEYYEPKFDINDPFSYFPRFNPDCVVYEDEAIIVANKPARLPSMPARDQRPYSLKSYLEAYTGTKIHMPSRLDMSASGLVIVSKCAAAHRSLQRSFERRQVEKSYLLEGSNRPLWKRITVDASIDKDRTHPVLRKTVPTGGKHAQTSFEIVRHSTLESAWQSHATSILLAKPLSGRTHQIRVHAQSIGLPVVGDNFYGGLAAPELHLLSYRLQIKHPLNSKLLDITLPEHLRPEWCRRLYTA